jgi:formylglycine-generating enzyme required for sulfatase activity
VSEGEVVPVVETVRLRPALVRLPGGSFLMGSQEYAEEAERPQRLVEVPAFSLCETEVTQGQYKAVMGENPSDCDVRLWGRAAGAQRDVVSTPWRT